MDSSRGLSVVKSLSGTGKLEGGGGGALSTRGDYTLWFKHRPNNLTSCVSQQSWFSKFTQKCCTIISRHDKFEESFELLCRSLSEYGTNKSVVDR